MGLWKEVSHRHGLEAVVCEREEAIVYVTEVQCQLQGLVLPMRRKRSGLTVIKARLAIKIKKSWN